MIEDKNLIGCCGIYCGEQHDWCSIYKCCVIKKELITCIECDEYPCERYKRRWAKYPEDWKIPGESLERIRREGVEDWLKEQVERRLLLEKMLENYNEGRSMSSYCKSCTDLPVKLIEKAIEKAEKRFESERIENSDIKSKAKIIKEIIRELVFTSDNGDEIHD
jgi:hypothetical protein